MTRVELVWQAGQRYWGADSAGHTVLLGADDQPGVRPADALLLALAGCSAYDVVAIARKQRLALARLSVTAEAERAARPPRAYTRIHLRYAAAAAGLTDAKLRRAVDLALNRYCSVRASLDPAIAVSFEVAVLEL